MGVLCFYWVNVWIFIFFWVVGEICFESMVFGIGVYDMILYFDGM